MAEPSIPKFAPRGTAADIEAGLTFQPKFDADGLVPAVVTDAGSGEVVMFAWMSAEALAMSIETGIAHFWTRSRGRIWKKGEDSGNTLQIVEMRTDCDQDALWLKVRIGGHGAACHTGQRSCFYRAIPLHARVGPDLTMRHVGGPAIFDPRKTYSS